MIIQSTQTGSQPVDRAAHAMASLVQNVGVDHGCAHVLVAELFPNRADVIPGFKQMRRKRVAEGVPHKRVGFARLPSRSAHARRSGDTTPPTTGGHAVPSSRSKIGCQEPSAEDFQLPQAGNVSIVLFDGNGRVLVISLGRVVAVSGKQKTPKTIVSGLDEPWRLDIEDKTGDFFVADAARRARSNASAKTANC